jgi:hypothetical protein
MTYYFYIYKLMKLSTVEHKFFSILSCGFCCQTRREEEVPVGPPGGIAIYTTDEATKYDGKRIASKG